MVQVSTESADMADLSSYATIDWMHDAVGIRCQRALYAMLIAD